MADPNRSSNVVQCLLYTWWTIKKALSFVQRVAVLKMDYRNGYWAWTTLKNDASWTKQASNWQHHHDNHIFTEQSCKFEDQKTLVTKTQILVRCRVRKMWSKISMII